MELKINLNYNPIIQLLNEPLILPATEPILLKFVSDTYADLVLMAFVKMNGKQYQHSVITDFPIDLTNILKAGKLSIEIKSLVKGKIVKSWEVAPIEVVEITPNFQLSDLYQALEKRVTALEKSHEIIL